jgi:hypothetical protein
MRSVAEGIFSAVATCGDEFSLSSASNLRLFALGVTPRPVTQARLLVRFGVVGLDVGARIRRGEVGETEGENLGKDDIAASRCWDGINLRNIKDVVGVVGVSDERSLSGVVGRASPASESVGDEGGSDDRVSATPSTSTPKQRWIPSGQSFMGVFRVPYVISQKCSN